MLTLLRKLGGKQVKRVERGGSERQFGGAEMKLLGTYLKVCLPLHLRAVSNISTLKIPFRKILDYYK